jgi:hypothetical protein
MAFEVEAHQLAYGVQRDVVAGVGGVVGGVHVRSDRNVRMCECDLRIKIYTFSPTSNRLTQPMPIYQIKTRIKSHRCRVYCCC